MFKLKINKSLCVASAFSVLAIGIDTTFGDRNVKFPLVALNELEGAKLLEIIIQARNENFETVNKSFWLDGIVPCDHEDEKSIIALRRLNFPKSKIRQLEPEERKFVFECIKNGIIVFGTDIDTARNILQSFELPQPYADDGARIAATLFYFMGVGPKKDFETNPKRQRRIMEITYRWNSIIRSMVFDFFDEISGLDFSGQGIRKSHITFIACVLKDNPPLMRLDLGANKIDDSKAKAIADALRTNTFLRILILGRNEIDDSGAKSLSEALKVNSSLTRLDLGANKIGVWGAKSLSEALKVNSSLTDFNLGGNLILSQGAKALTDALEVNTSLTVLNLGFCAIGDLGAKFLSEALKVNSFLTDLNLRYNEIGDSRSNSIRKCPTSTDLDWGVKAIAEGLKFNTSLTILNLSFNQIGDSGAKALQESLEFNSSLTDLNLEANPISTSYKKAITDRLESNIMLTKEQRY
ncbi:MAG: hypothetical protein ACSW8C_03645 [bacterium]